MKKCTKCLEDKPRSEFYKNKRAKDGLRSQCKSCTQSHNKRYYLENKGEMNEYSKGYYLKNKDRIGEDELAARRREDRYKMSSEQYQRLLEEQNHACAICGKVNASGQDLYVDHDHSCCFGSKSCGKCNRGLLCHKCNTAIGLFNDSAESLNKAAEYIKKYSIKEQRMHIKEVISEIRKIARLNPDIVYGRDIFNPGEDPCRYIVDGKGSCIVGRALVNLGIIPERLHEFEGMKARDALLYLSVGTDHPDQIEWVNRVQFHQDGNAPWGIAVEKADRYIEGLTLN